MDQLRINIFIDDKIQNITRVVSANTIEKAIWFNDERLKQIQSLKQTNHKNYNDGCKAKKLNPLIECIKSKQDRNKIIISKNWNSVHKALNKVDKLVTCEPK